MTRIIRDTEAPPAHDAYALGALVAAGHAIEDEVALELLAQLTRGELDFETYKDSVIKHTRKR